MTERCDSPSCPILHPELHIPAKGRPKCTSTGKHHRSMQSLMVDEDLKNWKPTFDFLYPLEDMDVEVRVSHIHILWTLDVS